MGPLLFLVMIANLPSKLQLFCIKLADNTKIEGETADVEIIQSGINDFVSANPNEFFT